MTTTLAATEVVLEVLYLDSRTCDPCRATTDAVDVAAVALAEHLRAEGRTLAVRRIHVTDPEQAEALGFVSSPTVRVDGVDIELGVHEQLCGSCSALAGERVLEHLAGALAPAPAPAGPGSVERFLAARVQQAIHAAALRSRMRGVVLAPGDDGFDVTRGTFNTLDDQRPALIVLPETVDDVIAVVEFAREHRLRIVPQRTGHNASPLGDIAGTLLLRTDAMRAVQIDAGRRIARVESGARWADVVPRASELGLAALHGSTPDVSIAGYASGGGLGWYGRKYGLAANSVTAIELVTADGRLRRVDHEHSPELFWALRGGGGGNFGVITAVEFRLYPVDQLYAGVLFFGWERSAEVLHAWHEWTATLGEETTSVGRILQFPDVPDVPEPLRGRPFVVVEAFHLGDESEGARILEPLRRLGPELDTFAMIPPVGLAEIHMDPTEALPYRTDHLVLADLTPAAIDDLVTAVGPGSGSELISVEIRHLGGALGRAEPGNGALARMPGEYLVFGVGATPDEPAERAVRSQLDAMVAAMRPLASGAYLNFTEHAVTPDHIFDDHTLRDLQRVRATYDPHALFRANHPIPAAA